ncbi:MAG TPA: DUF5985 family protein [Rhizomicrobium sp.]|jgi:hypothetical protein
MNLGASILYLLCLLTSALCAGLLIRSYYRHRTSLLLWSGICFALLALNNLFLVLDLVVFPDLDFSAARTVSALLAVGALIYGFVWETE